jgi:hypothetical protein
LPTARDFPAPFLFVATAISRNALARNCVPVLQLDRAKRGLRQRLVKVNER